MVSAACAEVPTSEIDFESEQCLVAAWLKGETGSGCSVPVLELHQDRHELVPRQGRGSWPDAGLLVPEAAGAAAEPATQYRRRGDQREAPGAARGADQPVDGQAGFAGAPGARGQ